MIDFDDDELNAATEDFVTAASEAAALQRLAEIADEDES